MNSNNFQDNVQNLEGITFRLLVDQDISVLIQIGANQYAYHNKALQNFNFTYEDSLNLMNSSDYVKIIEQGMSFGAFKEGKLVSYALGQDKAIITHKDIQLTPNVERLINSITSLQDTQTILNKGYCLLMIYLVTDHEFEGKGLCSVCFNMSCKVAIERGFKKYFVNAFHPGTKRITEKHFKVSQIVGEKQLENQELVWSISAMF